jgi:SH3-like domain-containing protein
MGASHFFVGLGAGIAILTVPVLTLAPGMDLPHRFATWIDGPQQTQAGANVAAVSRPERGYKPGDPTPAPDAAPPTIAPIGKPTAVPSQAVAQVVAQPLVQPPPSGSGTRTGVIRGGGTPVIVRRVAGVEQRDDPQLADGSPVLVSAGNALQVSGQAWRAVRGLNGIVGWVPSTQVVVDGEAPPLMVAAAAATVLATPGPIQVAGATSERLKVANTDGAGVVLRTSPRDADKTKTGLMDGAAVTVVERSGSDWVHVRADNGQEGWVPARYVVPAP